MWHVSSRSGVATLRTAIHLLLTYRCSQPALVDASADPAFKGMFVRPPPYVEQAAAPAPAADQTSSAAAAPAAAAGSQSAGENRGVANHGVEEDSASESATVPDTARTAADATDLPPSDSGE